MIGNHPEPMSPDDKFYIQSVNRAMAITEEVARAGRDGAALMHIAKQTGLPPSTAYRILCNLQAWNYVIEIDDKYRLGPNLARLGNLANHSIDLVAVAHDELRRLGELTGQTIYLSRFDRQAMEVCYIDKINARGPIQLSSEIGSRNMLHSTANGKIFLSALPDEEARLILASAGMPMLTEHTTTDPDAYIAELDDVRTRGIAFDREENEKNVFCVAAPVWNAFGSIAASISISGVRSLCTRDEIARWSELAADAAAALSARLQGGKQRR